MTFTDYSSCTLDYTKRHKSEAVYRFKQLNQYAETHTVSQKLHVLEHFGHNLTHVSMRPDSKCFALITAASIFAIISISTLFKMTFSTITLWHIPRRTMGWKKAWIAHLLKLCARYYITRKSRRCSVLNPWSQLYKCGIGLPLVHCLPRQLRTVYVMAKLPICHAWECIPSHIDRPSGFSDSIESSCINYVPRDSYYQINPPQPLRRSTLDKKTFGNLSVCILNEYIRHKPQRRHFPKLYWCAKVKHSHWSHTISISVIR